MKIKVWDTIQQLSKERSLDTDVIVNAIKESLKAASLKYFTNDEKIKVHFKPEKGEIRVYAVKKVKEKPSCE